MAGKEEKYKYVTEAEIRKKKLKSRIKKTVFFLIFGIITAGALLDTSGLFTYQRAVIFFGLRKRPIADSEVSVHFIDVGQGDSSLIISGDNYVLIDAGEIDKGSVVTDYLISQNVSRLDYVIATHPHSDHIGGMADVLEHFDTGSLIMPDVPDDIEPVTDYFRRLNDIIAEKNINVITACAGEEYAVGPAVLKITGPCAESEEINNYSAAAELIYKNNIFLFTGDCERYAEDEMLRMHMIDDVDVLKVGHHGSSSSSSYGFLKVARPEYAVISCGSDNSYGHPNASVVERLAKFTDEIYRTDLDGTVVFGSDGNNISVIR